MIMKKIIMLRMDQNLMLMMMSLRMMRRMMIRDNNNGDNNDVNDTEEYRMHRKNIKWIGRKIVLYLRTSVIIHKFLCISVIIKVHLAESD